MSVAYRFARAEELTDVARLAGHSFPAASRTTAWWLDQLRDPLYGGGVDTLWVGEDPGGLVAACQLHPLREWVGGAALPTMGMATVTIAPTHRRRGLAGRLVASALRAARERGDVASALFPFRVTFYAKLGYGLAGRVLQFRVPTGALPDAPERMQVEMAETEGGRAEVRAAYAAWAPLQTGQLERSERVWRELSGSGDRATVVWRGTDGRVEGYARVIYRYDLPFPDRYLEVDELVWMGPAARRGLLAWLGSLGDQWSHVLLRALPSQHLGELIGEPRLPSGSAPGWGLWFPSATQLVGPMFRLLDLPRAWAQRAVAPEAALEVALEVEDEQLEENRGAWRLRLEGGRAVAERASPGASALALRLDVGTLSRLFIGALSPSAAVEAGLAHCDRPERLPALDRALHLPEPWTFDRF